MIIKSYSMDLEPECIGMLVQHVYFDHHYLWASLHILTIKPLYVNKAQPLFIVKHLSPGAV